MDKMNENDFDESRIINFESYYESIEQNLEEIQNQKNTLLQLIKVSKQNITDQFVFLKGFENSEEIKKSERDKHGKFWEIYYVSLLIEFKYIRPMLDIQNISHYDVKNHIDPIFSIYDIDFYLIRIPHMIYSDSFMILLQIPELTRIDPMGVYIIYSISGDDVTLYGWIQGNDFNGTNGSYIPDDFANVNDMEQIGRLKEFFAKSNGE